VEANEDKTWFSSFKESIIFFACEEDTDLNLQVKLTKYDKFPWRLDIPMTTDVRSLRMLNDFQIYLIKLYQQGTEIYLDATYDEEDVEVHKQPEASFS
jgi:hypothetical protein